MSSIAVHHDFLVFCTADSSCFYHCGVGCLVLRGVSKRGCAE